jgi:NAD(P)-dependent dehydrogenase (short-subunit alcohol dehydrogenase family)
MTTKPWRDVPRQDGRTFVVTGASAGIGLETAKALAARGAHVVLAVRNLDKGRAAAEQMEGHVELGLLDVADLSSVRSFAETVEDVDVLVNNAGVLALPFGLSPDGVELHFATNHLGHFALANLLLPRITDRVVVVGSPSHRHGELDLGDLDWSRRSYKPYAAYADSKLANLLFLAELQRRLTAAGSTLRVTGAHPGTTATNITASTGSRLKTLVGDFGHKLVGMQAWQGALPTLYAATMDVPGNTYVGPHRLQEMVGWPTGVGRSQRALDPDLAKQLWTESERLSGVTFPINPR